MIVSFESTRGQAPHLDLRAVTMAGLADDGGLYVPETWPQISSDTLLSFKNKSYLETAVEILRPFTTNILEESALKALVEKAYLSFRHPAITPLKQLDDGLWILELFHGPTLAFKDIALQFLGCVFEYFLDQSHERITVIGATSGDTGSAAMAALAHRKNIDVFILYPVKGPSEIQRRQMTSMEAPNVHAVAIEGTFDDCQAIVKTLFNDPVLRQKHKFAAVNSINWLRIMAQMVYYFVAAAPFAPKPVSFVVPTGNFGNVYAAYAALQCRLPISKLGVASNSNDILTRFFNSGLMKAGPVKSTLSPSMDIQISSNFERLLFDLCHRDGASVRRFMDDIKTKGMFEVSPIQFAAARQIFTAAHADDETTLQTIRDIHTNYNYVLDPHTAVGVAAARQLKRELPEPVIALACAHPAKFPQTIERALGVAPEIPDVISSLMSRPERSFLLPADPVAVETFISKSGRL